MVPTPSFLPSLSETSVPFPTRRPVLKEVDRVHHIIMVCSFHLEVWRDDLVAELARSVGGSNAGDGAQGESEESSSCSSGCCCHEVQPGGEGGEVEG